MVSQLVYLACPYSHDDAAVRLARFEEANKASAVLMRAGVLVFSPISHTHPIAQYDLPTGWDFWQRYNRAYLEICKAIVVLTIDGWAKSKGVREECGIMRELHRSVYYFHYKEPVDELVNYLNLDGRVEQTISAAS